MMENKKALTILKALILAICSSILALRMGDFPLKTYLIVFIFLTLGFYFLLTYIEKKDYRLNQRKKTIGMILSFLLSIGTILSFKSYFLYEYRDATVTIEKEVENFADVDFIEAFIIDNVRYVKLEDGYYNSYLYAPCDKISFEYGENLKIDFQKSRNVSIILRTTEDIAITEKDKTTSQKAEMDPLKENYYKISSNRELTPISGVYFILSFALFFTLFYSLYKFFINKKDNVERKIFLGTLLGTSLIGLYYYFTSQTSILYNDSSSYIEFSFRAFLNLQFNGRTPIYPLIIHLNQFLFQENYMMFICICQYVIWFISLVFLYKTFILLTKKSVIASLATVLYALSPTVVGWNNVLLTESIALSGTIIFIYFIISYLKKGRLADGIIAIVTSFVLTFHRPTSIIYLVMLVCFFIARIIFEKKSRRQEIKCLGASLFGILLIVIYAIIFHKTFGIYSISDAMPRQDLYVSLREGFYKNSSDQEFIDRADAALKNNPLSLWDSIGELKTYYDLKEIKELTREAKTNDMTAYKDYISRLIENHIPVKYEGYSYTGINEYREINRHIPSIFSILIFGHSYIALSICFIAFIVLWIKTKKLPYIYAGLFAFPFAIILSTFIGTCDEFMRTAICAMPFTYISIVLLLADLTNIENYTRTTHK